MTITGTYGEHPFSAMCRILPSDPEAAVHISLSVAASTCIAAGLKDDQALRAFDAAIRTLRQAGLTKVVQ